MRHVKELSLGHHPPAPRHVLTANSSTVLCCTTSHQGGKGRSPGQQGSLIEAFLSMPQCQRAPARLRQVCLHAHGEQVRKTYCCLGCGGFASLGMQ